MKQRIKNLYGYIALREEETVEGQSQHFDRFLPTCLITYITTIVSLVYLLVANINAYWFVTSCVRRSPVNYK
jgi:hypothetical protein